MRQIVTEALHDIDDTAPPLMRVGAALPSLTSRQGWPVTSNCGHVEAALLTRDARMDEMVITLDC